MPKTILIDTNLLVLLIVGMTSEDYIEKHKRLRPYDILAFKLLQEIISSFYNIVVTPNSLSETSNILNHIADPERSRIYGVFSELIPKFEERFILSRVASTRREFVRLGLTDSVLLEACVNDVVLLTVDLDLYLSALENNYSAINFDYVRQERGLLP